MVFCYSKVSLNAIPRDERRVITSAATPISVDNFGYLVNDFSCRLAVHRYTSLVSRYLCGTGALTVGATMKNVLYGSFRISASGIVTVRAIFRDPVVFGQRRVFYFSFILYIKFTESFPIHHQ